MGRKLALIIGNSDYQDADLARLVTPHEDVSDLAAVLRASDIGEFDEVRALVNEPSANIRLEIESFFAEKKPDDLLLMYFSGHGVRDDQGQLYLAVKDTRHNRLRATAIPAAFITDGMDHSRSQRQILVLDCCHSGAFAQGAKGVTGESVGIKTAFEGIGYGRVVLTATDATQYAWEGDQVIGEAENSVFTHYLIEGLKTGAADTDSDGRITLDELYDYVYEQVVKATPKQTPGKWSYKQQGELVIARNPHPIKPKPVELPVELRQLIESPIPSAREAATRELSHLLNGSLPDLTLVAHEALKRLADDDSRRVANAAAQVLAANAEAQRVKESMEAEARAQEEAARKKRAEEARARREAEEQARREAQAKVEMERLAREKAEQERLAAQKAEAETILRAKEEQQRPATQKGEAERLTREKTEQERLAREKAEAERLAARRAGEERTAREKAEQERLAREQVETQRSSIAQTGPPSAAQVIWLPTLLATIGWGITLAVFVPSSGSPGGVAAIGAICGLVTGLTLRWRHPSFRWMQIISISIVWGISLGIAPSNPEIGLVIGLACFGGLLSGLVLRWAEPSIGWKPIFAVVVGWGFGWLIGFIALNLFEQRVGNAGGSGIGGALVGAVGSGVMHWQLSRARRRKST